MTWWLLGWGALCFPPSPSQFSHLQMGLTSPLTDTCSLMYEVKKTRAVQAPAWTGCLKGCSTAGILCCLLTPVPPPTPCPSWSRSGSLSSLTHPASGLWSGRGSRSQTGSRWQGTHPLILNLLRLPWSSLSKCPLPMWRSWGGVSIVGSKDHPVPQYNSCDGTWGQTLQRGVQSLKVP